VVAAAPCSAAITLRGRAAAAAVYDGWLMIGARV
jgi:hypothetical protein